MASDSESARLINDSCIEDEPSLLSDGTVRRVKGAAVVQWSIALGLTFLLSLEAMGYQGLLPALYKGRVFGYLCTDDELSRCDSQTKACCTKQQHQLDLMFTLSYSVMNIISFPVGIFMHTNRPRIISLTALSIKALSYVCLAVGLSPWISSHASVIAIPGFVLIASFGLASSIPFLNIPAHIFPTKYEGLCCSLLMGAADASSLWYYVIRVLYLDHGVSLHASFLAYAGVAALGAALANHLLRNLKSPVEAAEDLRIRRGEDAVEKVGLLRRMATKEFAVVCNWHCAFFCTKYFYFTNFTAEARWTTGSEERALNANTFFSLILPFTGLLAPFVGWLQHRHGLRISVAVNTFLAAVVIVGTCTPWYPLLYPSALSLAASRFMVFAIVPPMCSRVWGPEGTVFFSLASGIAGALSLINFALAVWREYLIINIALGGWCLASSVVLIAFLTQRGIE